ncbi:MAG: HD domain-containing protein, partial [Clostridia bacterium]|nr:HD domain-containing protein [Clostridia bacterium]
ITTFRSDGEYKDNRHPESVEFSRNIADDLSRRDFTVNAMAYNHEDGLIDLFGGVGDLKNGVIRTVGDPDRRFGEDALRILRAFRFASQKGFTIAPETAGSALRNLHLLRNLSAERVYSELKKLLLGKNAEKIMLDYPEVICAVIPELKNAVGFDQCNPHHIYDVYTHTVKAVCACPKDPILRLAALLHDVGKPDTFSLKDGIGHFYGHSDKSMEIAEQVLTRLKADNYTKNTALILIKYHDPVIAPEEKSVKRYMNRLTPEVLSMLLDLKGADNLAQAPECAARLETYAEIRRIMAEITEKNECFSKRQLALNGDDLIALGIPRGRRIGQILDALLEEVTAGNIENEKDALTEFVKRFVTAKNL